MSNRTFLYVNKYRKEPPNKFVATDFIDNFISNLDTNSDLFYRTAFFNTKLPKIIPLFLTIRGETFYHVNTFTGEFDDTEIMNFIVLHYPRMEL